MFVRVYAKIIVPTSIERREYLLNSYPVCERRGPVRCVFDVNPPVRRQVEDWLRLHVV